MEDRSTATTTALLYLNGINVSFDGFRALNNLSLSVEPGERSEEHTSELQSH